MKSTNVSWWVERWAELTPREPAVVFEGETVTFRGLNTRVDEVCSWLQSYGLERGDRVAVVLRNCPEFLELYLACARLGAIFVPLNWRLGMSELDYLLADARPRVLVYARDLANHIRCRARSPVGASNGFRWCWSHVRPVRAAR